MQGAYITHLKRGIHFAGECLKHKQAAHGRVQILQIGQQPAGNPLEDLADRFQSPAAIITLGVTLLAFFVFISAVDYAINAVVTNLAIVEDTNGSNIALPHKDEPDATLEKAPLLDDYESKVPIPSALPSKPITSKLRTAFRHLHSVGGFRARFRGVRYAAFYHLVLSIFSAILQLMFAPLGPLGFWFGSTAAAVLSCNLHAAWTHATIAAPSNKPFFQRFLPRPVASQLMLPTLRLHLATGFLHLATAGSAWVAMRFISDAAVPRIISLNLVFLPVLVALGVALLAVLPSYIALIRAEASLLPEDMAAIVPFDRTFNGRFLQEAGPRCARIFKGMSVRGAWTLFDRETFRRVVKIQVKSVAIIVSTIVLFTGVLLAEAFVIAGGEDNVRKALRYAMEQKW